MLLEIVSMTMFDIQIQKLFKKIELCLYSDHESLLFFLLLEIVSMTLYDIQIEKLFKQYNLSEANVNK